jgi:hypothetical protein
MQLTRDPSNDDLAEIVFAGDQERLQRILGALPEWAHAAAEHPDAFWERQQAEIKKRTDAVPQRSSRRVVIAWASATAVVLLATLLLRSSPAPPPSLVQSDVDQELLLAVEQSLQSGVPQALEPAALLADEINRSAQPILTSHGVSKENQNEGPRNEDR